MDSEFQTSLRSFGTRVGLSDLSFDSAGRALLSVDGGRRVGMMLVPTSNSLILTTGMSSCEPDDCRFFSLILQLNGLTEAEDDLRLGLTPDRDQVVAIRIVPVELAPELGECIALFIEASDRISDFLTTLQSQGSDDEECKPEDWNLRV